MLALSLPLERSPARVTAEIPEIDFGIGVASGEAVVGNVGGTSRYEYTVIGDPVNEAARLGELAKTLARPRRGLGRGASVRPASAGWTVADEVLLRGRRPTPTAIGATSALTASARAR